MQFHREQLTEQLRPIQSNLLKPWAGKRGSQQQSCDTAVDVSSGVITVAVAEHSPGESLVRSESPDLASEDSHHDLSGAVSQAAAHHASGSVRVWDLTSLQRWSSVCKQLDASLANVLESGEEKVIQTEFKVNSTARSYLCHFKSLQSTAAAVPTLALSPATEAGSLLAGEGGCNRRGHGRVLFAHRT